MRAVIRNKMFDRAIANGWSEPVALAAWIDAVGDLWDELVFMAYYEPLAEDTPTIVNRPPWWIDMSGAA